MVAGRGPAPKDPSRRARRNADPIPSTTIRFERGVQPELPEGYPWPQQTREWWRRWAESPLSDHFMQSDWDFLLDTALVHAELWAGNIGAASELRLRVAKLGATPEDRARLRLSFAEADEKDAARPAGAGARERYGHLRSVVGGGAAEVTPIKQAARKSVSRAKRPAGE